MFNNLIHFYIPPEIFPQNISLNVDQNWAGFGLGIYAWTLQTYLRLKADNFPCKLVNKIPEKGIVIVHRKSLDLHQLKIKSRKNILLVCIKSDAKPYPSAQIQIVQNPVEASIFHQNYYIPHWTQPGLIPRDPQRGDCFKHIAFFGHKNNLVSELLKPEWQVQLKRLNLNWCPIINQNHWTDYRQIDNRWNDYRQIDAIVAIRSFGKSKIYSNKPATKLYNSWLAGVPAILGYESAYWAEGKPNFNYLEVTSLDELILALQQLKESPKLRKTLIENGKIRAKEIHPDKITQKWRDFLEQVAIPAFEEWCSKPQWMQNLILETRYLSLLRNRVESKLTSLQLKVHP